MSKHKKIKASCSVPGCDRLSFVGDKCGPHYRRYQRTGDVNAAIPIGHVPPHDYTKYVGRRYGKWLVLEFVRRQVNGTILLCRCDCGTVKEVPLGNLSSGASGGCSGCSSGTTKHALSHHPCYTIWNNMMNRCYNKKSREYRYYGGKGVRVCSRWHDIKNFIEDIPEKVLGKCFTLTDRTKDFSLSNTHWDTRSEITKHMTTKYAGKLIAIRLALATGYSHERIRQITNAGMLDNYIISRKNTGKNVGVIYKDSAIEFLKSYKLKMQEKFPWNVNVNT